MLDWAEFSGTVPIGWGVLQPACAPRQMLGALLTIPAPRPASFVSMALGLWIATTFVACAPQAPPPQEPVPTAEAADPPTESHATGDPRLRTVYVPAYSHLQGAPHHAPYMLSILLSVRNMDSQATVKLTHVDFFDTSGHRVRRYLSAPVSLEPLQTREFKVERQDEAGGSGANFLVYWEGPSDAHPLLTEAVMWGHAGAGYISFTSRGVELDRRPDPATFTGAPAATLPPAPTGTDASTPGEPTPKTP